MSIGSRLRTFLGQRQFEQLWSTSDSFDYAVVGESHYQHAIAEAARAHKEKDGAQRPVIEVALVREPSNRFDPNAIQIQTLNGKTLAYFAADLASEFAPILDALTRKGLRYCCKAVVAGGTPGKPSYGLFLAINEGDWE